MWREYGKKQGKKSSLEKQQQELLKSKSKKIQGMEKDNSLISSEAK
ncbi:hypothetical protein SMU86_09385 [Streptococcus mutans U2A]|nr:hypothetical protein SMU86_09385 [Streptococcus mutans U2A]EMC56443.1 hypothetical protein SMU109_07701 [Streptococcus mutans OMZ175]